MPTAGPPGVRPRAGHRDDHRPAGAGHRQRRRYGAGRAHAGRALQPGEPAVDHYTYFIATDGDIEEGISPEARSLAGHLGLGKLIGFYDDNHISIEGDTALAFSEDTGTRYEAYGWHVQHIGEGNDLDRARGGDRRAQAVEDRPALIIVRTHIAHGAPHKQDTESAHGSPLGEEEIKLTKEAYGCPSQEPFFVPDEALAHFRGCIERGREQQAEWEERVRRVAQPSTPTEARELERVIAARLPDGWEEGMPRFRPDAGMVATRKAGHKVLQWAAAGCPSWSAARPTSRPRRSR